MNTRQIAKNAKAFHEYDILEKLEAGMVLTGTEVKSIRDGRVNLKESFVGIRRGEVWLLQCHISPYSHCGPTLNHDPVRRRKLLLHRREIMRLVGKVQEKGLTLIPLSMYSNEGRIKVEIGVCRGRKTVDKRAVAQEKTQKREVERMLKERRYHD